MKTCLLTVLCACFGNIDYCICLIMHVNLHTTKYKEQLKNAKNNYCFYSNHACKHSFFLSTSIFCIKLVPLVHGAVSASFAFISYLHILNVFYSIFPHLNFTFSKYFFKHLYFSFNAITSTKLSLYSQTNLLHSFSCLLTFSSSHLLSILNFCYLSNELILKYALFSLISFIYEVISFMIIINASSLRL